MIEKDNDDQLINLTLITIFFENIIICGKKWLYLWMYELDKLAQKFFRY